MLKIKPYRMYILNQSTETQSYGVSFYLELERTRFGQL